MHCPENSLEHRSGHQILQGRRTTVSSIINDPRRSCQGQGTGQPGGHSTPTWQGALDWDVGGHSLPMWALEVTLLLLIVSPRVFEAQPSPGGCLESEVI